VIKWPQKGRRGEILTINIHEIQNAERTEGESEQSHPWLEKHRKDRAVWNAFSKVLIYRYLRGDFLGIETGGIRYWISLMTTHNFVFNTRSGTCQS
jgi:hypothetical protein